MRILVTIKTFSKQQHNTQNDQYFQITDEGTKHRVTKAGLNEISRNKSKAQQNQHLRMDRSHLMLK